MRYRFQRFLIFITLFQLFSQSCAVLNDKNVNRVEFPIQICDGDIVEYNEDQKAEIIQKFTKTFPLADPSEKTRIFPRLNFTHLNFIYL
jgi:hypothetical protein